MLGWFVTKKEGSFWNGYNWLELALRRAEFIRQHHLATYWRWLLTYGIGGCLRTFSKAPLHLGIFLVQRNTKLCTESPHHTQRLKEIEASKTKTSANKTKKGKEMTKAILKNVRDEPGWHHGWNINCLSNFFLSVFITRNRQQLFLLRPEEKRSARKSFPHRRIVVIVEEEVIVFYCLEKVYLTNPRDIYAAYIMVEKYLTTAQLRRTMGGWRKKFDC